MKAGDVPTPGRGFITTRRELMQSLGYLTAALTAGAARGEVTGRPDRALGIQLYTFSEWPPAKLLDQLPAIRAIGYSEVETGPLAGVEAATLKARLDAAGLICPSCHFAIEPLQPGVPSLAEPERALAYARTLGASRAVVASMPFMAALSRSGISPADFTNREKIGAAIMAAAKGMTRQDWSALAARLNRLGEATAAQGVRLGYHNHHFEFFPLADGATGFDVLLAETDPAHVSFELDVGWVAYAGRDPAALLLRHGARIDQVHLKDMRAPAAAGALPTPGIAFGAGDVDWPALARVLRKATIPHIYIEQEPPLGRPPLEAAREAYAFARTQLS